MVNGTATRDAWLLGAGPGSEAVAQGLRDHGWRVAAAAAAAALAGVQGVPDALVVLPPRLEPGCGAAQLAADTAAAVAELVQGCQQAVKRMARAGRPGAIVIVTDIAGIPGRAGHAAQATLSGALIGAGKCLAKELGRQRVSVNLVAHGFMPALGTTDRLGPAEARLFELMSLGRAGEVAHLVDNIVHLIGNRHLMTGQVLHVDDGLVI